MWRQYIQEMLQDSKRSTCDFFTGATESQIEDLENQLQVKLFDGLKMLLKETNGINLRLLMVGGRPVEENEHVLAFVWSVEDIVSENLRLRASNYDKEVELFKNLLFFGSVGNGDELAFRATEGQILNEDIMYWNHDDGSCTKTMSSLQEYLEALREFK